MKKKTSAEGTNRRSQILALIGLVVIIVMLLSALAPSATDVRSAPTPTIPSLLATRVPTRTLILTPTLTGK